MRTARHSKINRNSFLHSKFQKHLTDYKMQGCHAVRHCRRDRTNSWGCVVQELPPLCVWEAGGGRICRQPGQVRKEAALTILDSGRSSVSHYALAGAVRIASDPAPSAGARLAASPGRAHGPVGPSPLSQVLVSGSFFRALSQIEHVELRVMARLGSCRIARLRTVGRTGRLA